ncbi:UPF0193 protein EVG1 isoform X2 [Neoarius graeffei]|nr:UPF0193 protein EVG1 isoform X2 [Neoarius graeffei]
MDKMKCVTPHERNNNKGLWDCPRFKYSKDTQELIQVMMREARLTNLQQQQINNQLKNGGALPLSCKPTSSKAPAHPEPRVQKHLLLSFRPQKRSAEKCSAGDNYIRERFRPSATRDLEKEKRRLQNIFATGQEEEMQPSLSHRRPANKKDDSEKDRFQEVLDEIEDRRQFLKEMEALGNGREYYHIINTEISQKIRELELIDRARSKAIRMQEEKDGEQQ